MNKAQPQKIKKALEIVISLKDSPHLTSDQKEALTLIIDSFIWLWKDEQREDHVLADLV